jgi:hypothetical protein
MTRHSAVKLALALAPLLCALQVFGEAQKPIDRQALVTRHNVVLHRFDPNDPLTVGNGE